MHPSLLLTSASQTGRTRFVILVRAFVTNLRFLTVFMVLIFKGLECLIIVGSIFDDWIYWYFFIRVTADY
jgi:hypothetical protein